ncbi:MAG: serine/threonine protein kinase [Thermoguttaceae bacterium]|nr:serine/threonine protein kinase [Thermoguttaceae bacterium]
MAKLSVDLFLEYLRKSEITDEQSLNAALEQILASASPEEAADADYIAQKLIEAELITSWQTRQLMKGKYKGFFLRHYKILGHLGSGGMSTVYLAEHTLMQRRVAIKVLPKKRLSNAAYLERFVREAQAIASLDHPHIVRAYDIDRFEDVHYIVMEYFEGRNLRQIVDSDGPLSYEDAVNYIRQGAEGLIHAHRIGIIHRDVKPENLLANDEGLVKLLDLGLALLDENIFTHSNSSSIADDKILGTADYLAPEQAINSHSVDARADIYSLGCTLYFCLTGHAPFPTGTIPQRLLAHQRQQPASIFVDRPDAPQDLVKICEKMMAKNPDDRYQSAQEVSEVLSRWLVKHGFASEHDFEGEFQLGAGDDALADDENDLISNELSYLRSGQSAINLADTSWRAGDGSEILSSGQKDAVNLFSSASGSASHVGDSSKELLLSRSVVSQSGRLDPLDLAMSEIQTGKEKLPEGAQKSDDPARPLPLHRRGPTDRILTARNKQRAQNAARSGTAKQETKSEPTDGLFAGDWHKKVPFWFWAVFVAGYVLATFLAGILFALLLNLNEQ